MGGNKERLAGGSEGDNKAGSWERLSGLSGKGKIVGEGEIICPRKSLWVFTCQAQISKD